MTCEYSDEWLLAEGVDAEWIILHKWIRTFRKARGLTISSFLSICRLQPSSPYYKSMCSFEMGILRCPSCRGGAGKVLRDAVKELMVDGDRYWSSDAYVSTFENAIEDWETDNIKALHSRGIESVEVIRAFHVEYTLVIGHDFTPPDQLIQMIWSDPHIQNNFSKDDVQIEWRWILLLINRNSFSLGGTGTGSVSEMAELVSVENTPHPMIIMPAAGAANRYRSA